MRQPDGLPNICDYCFGDPFALIYGRAGAVELCFEHVKMFTGWNAEEVEYHTGPFRNHLLDGLKKAGEE